MKYDSDLTTKQIKTTSASEARGINGGKNEIRKRHIVTDIMGNLLAVIVHAANIHDTVVGKAVFQKALKKYQSILGVCADAGYRKTFEAAVANLGRTVDISERIKPNEWQIPPKCWRVEQTFAWMNNSR